MYVLATILLVLSIIKIIMIFISDNVEINDNLIDPESLYKMNMLMLAIDGVIGLTCSLFILLW